MRLVASGRGNLMEKKVMMMPWWWLVKVL